MKKWKWKYVSGLYERYGVTEHLKEHSYFDGNGRKVATMWTGEKYHGWRCFRLDPESEAMFTDSFFYADTVKEGKSRIEKMFEPDILGAVADMANPNLPKIMSQHNRL